ncbi:hypothetical protein HS062_09260 [Mannheimia haemolytica]|nr:hypothetical protein [Mannheimia haemolytica]
MTTFQKNQLRLSVQTNVVKAVPHLKKKSKNLNANLVKRQKNHHVQLLSH